MIGMTSDGDNAGKLSDPSFFQFSFKQFTVTNNVSYRKQILNILFIFTYFQTFIS